MSKPSTIALLVMLLASSSSLFAQAPSWPLANAKVIHLPEGPSRVDILGSGRPGLVVRGHRENFNAHSFDYFTFYVTYPDSEGQLMRWDIVPFEVGEQFQPGFATSQGADCVLRDLRLLKPDRRFPTAMILITADRDAGASFAAEERVTFTLYEVQTNPTGLPGEPGIYFAPSDQFQPAQRYCDVEEAFRKELGL